MKQQKLRLKFEILTLAMHLWRQRSCSIVGSSSTDTVLSLNVPSDKGEPTMSLQVLPKNRCTPSMPLVLHVFESLGLKENQGITWAEVKVLSEHDPQLHSLTPNPPKEMKTINVKKNINRKQFWLRNNHYNIISNKVCASNLPQWSHEHFV